MRVSHLSFLLFISLLALLSVSSISAAQTGPFRIYTTRDGLAGDYITAIEFEPNGSAWVGTTEGATHIEPQRWTSYTRVHGLGDSWITAIAIAPDGRVWFGTHSGGVSVLDPVSKTITTYNLDNSEIPSNFITQVILDSENQVWIGTLENGVAQFDAATQQWSRHALTNTHIAQLTHGFDEQRTLWAIADGRVYALQGDQWKLRELPNDERAVNLFDDHRQMVAVTRSRMFIWNGNAWDKYTPFTGGGLGPWAGILQEPDITASGEGVSEEVWFGTARGLYIFNPTSAVTPPKPFPVVLIHGWTVAGDDTLETSEFRFLKSYADRDGIPMYYVRGVSPKNTLYQNAQVIRDEIARVKKETGADKVNILAFSMGGMNARAYLETSLYANDVNRAIILGTPQAGVEIWKPILFQQILQKPDEPSAIELAPEYAQQVVNQTRAPNPNVPYDLLIGDAREQAGLEFIQDMPASDALISVNNALALEAPNVRKHVNADLHDWSPEPVPLDLTGYLYPRDTWERYLRNALRNNDNAPIGSEIPPSPVRGGAGGGVWVANHTPVVTEKIRASETVTRTVLIDENKSARFIAYYPGGKINFSIIAPDGKKYEPSDLPREDETGVLSLSTDIASFSGYVVKNAPVGEWRMILERADKGSETINVSTYVELDSPLHVEVYPDPVQMRVGEPKTIRAFVNLKAMSAQEQSRDVRIIARVAQPSTEGGDAYTFSALELFDDGQHNDSVAGDGTYGNAFVPSRDGWHLVFVQVRGKNFVREQEAAFPIISSGAKLASQATVETRGNEIIIQTGVETSRAGNYAVRAEIKRPNSDKVVARTFVPVKLDAGVQHISIPIDARKIPPGEYGVSLRLYHLDWAAFGLDPAALVATFVH